MRQKWHTWDTPGRKPLLPEKKHRNLSHICQKHLGDLQDFGEDILCADETKVELFDSLVPIKSGANLTQHKNNTIPTVKCGDSVKVCGCFTASGSGWLAGNDGTMNSDYYQKIQMKNVQTFDLKIKHTLQVHIWRAYNHCERLVANCCKWLIGTTSY